jgi:hypothetical protein
LVVYEDENLPYAAVKLDFNDEINTISENGQAQFLGIEACAHGMIGPTQADTSSQTSILRGMEFELTNPVIIESGIIRKTTTSGTHTITIQL